MARLSSKASDTILSSYRDHVALGPNLRPSPGFSMRPARRAGGSGS